MICVLQFDAASVTVLERLLAAGRLESLAALIERGERLELETPAVDFAAGSFFSLYSGVELGDHGIFYPFQFSPSEQRARLSSAFDAPPAVWERLGRSGMRTLAIDPYECRPPARAEGTFICGWGFKDRVVLPRWSRPPGAGRRLARRHGRGPAATEIFGQPSPAELHSLREKLSLAPARTAAVARELLASESFDLVWLTFPAAHLAGHQFWDFSQLDPDALERNPGARDSLARALDDVYVAVDRAIGEVIDALGPGVETIVCSAVGMDVNTSRADLLPEMLAAVLSGRPANPGDDAGAIWRLRAAVPPGLRRAVADAIPDRAALELTARLELRGIDWRTTRAFAHPADNQGYVRFNLAGREAQGIVAADEAAALAEEISEGLMSFRDADGSPSVEAVVEAPERYPGKHATWLPDLVVRWADRPATRLGEVSSERFGTVRRRGVGSGRSGNHTPGDAWAVLAPAAARLRPPSRPARLVDIAATICELSGADPSGLPGEPLMVR